LRGGLAAMVADPAGLVGIQVRPGGSRRQSSSDMSSAGFSPG
jgi:hypothetical protein